MSRYTRTYLSIHRKKGREKSVGVLSVKAHDQIETTMSEVKC